MGWIRNRNELAISGVRRYVLDIIEAGFDSIATDKVIARSVSVGEGKLTVAGRDFDLTGIERIRVIGFGKASCQAAAALEKVLGERIGSGVVIGNAPSTCEIITTYQGSHPLPSEANVSLSEKMIEDIKGLTEKDLVIVLVSGGGSALLCWPATECGQGQRLYHASVHSGMTIQELNTVRKHLSLLKGGGLAKMLYPAKVISLIFSDVPGKDYDMVASGPTYPDRSTIADAQAVIDKYELGDFKLIETPKESKWFDRITNIVLVSNEIALKAMADKAASYGYSPVIMGSDLYEEPAKAIGRMCSLAKSKSIVLAGGEYRIKVIGRGGKGGRNQHAALMSLDMINSTQTFVSIASDGLDNTDAAGAIIDEIVRRRVDGRHKEAAAKLASFDEYGILREVGSLVMTGPTQTNVSDLSFLLTE